MVEKLLRPAEHAEKQLIEAILSFKYRSGDVLPAERILAAEFGVTRPTLRETLQRLSREGWVTIQHGKSTKVNDYIKSGGLGILSSLAKYGKKLSPDMVSHLLEVRTTMFPDIVQKAVINSPLEILNYLRQSKTLEGISEVYAEYDWQFQMLVVKATKNPVFNMILNDFAPVYSILGRTYFQRKDARAASLKYYGNLIAALEQNNTDVKPIVEKIMILSQKIWQEIK